MSQPMKRTYLRNGIVLPLLLFLLFYVAYFTFLAVAQSSDVHILDFTYPVSLSAAASMQSYRDGFNASLWSRNFTLAGRKVDMIKMNPASGVVASSIEQAVGNSDDLFVVLGPRTTKVTKEALPALRSKSVVAFGPVIRTPTLRKWDKHLYYFIRSTGISCYALLRHAVINMRVRRIGVMYTTGVSFGHYEYVFMTNLMKGMTREFCGVFSIDGKAQYPPDDKKFNEAYETFFETRPQVVMILGLNNNATNLFIQKFLKDPRTTSTDLLLVYSEKLTLGLWEKAIADGTTNFKGRVIMASSYPDSYSNSSAMARKFRSVADAYFQDRVNKGYDTVKRKAGGWTDGSATLSGWVAGEILFQALSGLSPALNRTEFISSIYNQRSYLIEELIIGKFGDEISKEFQKSGAVACCNEGAATAHLKQFSDPKHITSILEGQFVSSIRICRHHNMTLADSAAIVTVNFTDRPGIYYLIREVEEGQVAGFSYLHSVPKHDMTLKVLQATYVAVTSTVRKEKEDKWVNIVTGLMHEETLDIPNLTFIDPILTVAKKNKFRKNVVFLLPTPDQQLFVLAEYVASLPDHTLHAIFWLSSERELLDRLKKSLLTFGLRLTSSILMGKSDKIEDKLPSSGLTLLFGTHTLDVPKVIAHLERNTNSRVIVFSVLFFVMYEQLISAFKDKEFAERFLLVTNLPHWADKNSKSKVVRKYHKQITDSSEWSPMSLQSFVVGRFIRRVVEELEVVNASSVIEYFYSSIVVNLDEMAFGPFADSTSVTCASGSDPDSLGCAKNFGATSISVWPMSRVFDPNVRPLFGPVTPSMVYRLSTGLTKAQQIAVIVGSLLGAAVLAVVIGLLIYFFCTGNANAPKDPEAPVTLIFTDIQSSTTLWAVCPEIMPDAVETHHRLIRRLIAKYKCYEVKTVGDSFMIACKSAYAAVQLVGDLQRTFLHHDWGTSAFDKAYHEFEEHQAEEDEDYKPPTARLDDAVYRELWNGLRVRAGVHTGLSDIRFDEVTGRYDYYGSTSNTAARTESIANGGQVLLTRAAYMALSSAERKDLNVTALGAVELRGVPEPVEILQLNAVPGRTFAKLRLERGNEELEFDTSTFNGTETSGSMSEKLSPAAENVFAVLHDTFAAFPPPQRLKALEPLCKRWGVIMPMTKNREDVLAVGLLAEQRLAMKIARVIERRQSTYGSTTDASELLSSTRGSFLMQNHPKPSSFRGNWISKPDFSKLSQGTEKHGGLCQVSFSLNRGSSSLSATSSIHVKRPSFLGVEWV